MTCGGTKSNCATLNNACTNRNPRVPCHKGLRKITSCGCCPTQKVTCAVKRRQNVVSYGPTKSVSKRTIRYGGPTTVTFGVKKQVKCKTINVCDWRNSPCCSCTAVNYRRLVNRNPNSVVCGEVCFGGFCCP